MPMHCFDRAELPTMPWKNGGGVTREIACVPSGADLEQFDWRVSIAHVTSCGPFSSFPGIDRVITLLEGAGVRLFGADESIDHRLDQVLTPWAFPGEALIQCSLMGADCEDFNVMTRRSRCRAEVQVLKSSQKLQRANGGYCWPVAAESYSKGFPVGDICWPLRKGFGGMTSLLNG